MQDYSFTKHRIFQWMGIILALGIIAVGYWYYRSQASTLNQSQNSSNTTGLVGLWSFNGDDVSGTTAYDRSGSGNNGTLTNGPTKVPGKVGQALSLDGTDDYVDMGGASTVEPTFPFSVSAWVKCSDITKCVVVTSSDTGGNGQYSGFTLGAQSDGSLFVILGNNACNGDPSCRKSFVTAASVVTTGTWYHITGVITDISTGAIYVNGVGHSVSVSGTAASMAYATNSRFRVGAYYDTSGPATRYAQAIIDEVRLYNTALTAAQIQSLYALGQSDKMNSSVSQPQGTGRLNSDLALYWPLDNGSGTTATDVSTNGNNGTLTCFGALCSVATWTTGQIGSGVDFDGSQDYVSASDPSSGVLDFADSTNFTITGWFNRDTFTTDDTILAKRNGTASGDVGYLVFVDASGDNLYFEASDGTDEYSLRSSATNVFTASGWHHYAIVWDDSGSGQTKLYINGFLDTAVTAGTFGSVNSLANSVEFRLGVESDDGNPFDGKLDEARVYGRALSADEITQLYRLTSPTGVDTSLKGYWSFNGQDVSGASAYDRSGAGNTGTLTSGPTKTIGKIGQALSFDGTDDYVTMADANSLDITSAISMAVWLKTSDTDSCIMSKTVASTAKCFESASNKVYELGVLSSTIYFQASNGTTTNGLSGSATNFLDNQWHYIVATWDGTTATNGMKLYMDGVVLHQGTATVTSIQSTSSALTFGGDGGTYDYAGLMDEGRLYNRALSAAEIKALYDAGASDKTNSSLSQPQGTGRLDSGLAGYWRMDDGSGSSATDSSTNGNTGTLTNGPTWTTGQIGGAVTFDGINDYITIPDNDLYDVGTVATYSAWVNPAAIGSGMYIFEKTQSGAEDKTLYISSAGKAAFYLFNVTDWFDGGIESTTTLSAGTWYHIAGTYDGVRARLYVNGVLENSRSATGNVADSIGALVIGSRNGVSNFFSGSIDEFRFYNRTLSADEVAQLYRLTTPTGVDTGLKGYWSFNGQDVSGSSAFDRSGSGNTGTLGGDVTKSLGKIGQGLAFGGTNGIVDMNDINAMDGVANVTLSAWMKRSATNSIVTVGKSADQYRRFNINFYSDGNVYINVGTGSGEPYGYFASNDTNWHHVVVVFDGSLSGNSNRLKAYVDGVATSLTFSGTIPATTNSNSDDFTLGYAPLFGGYTVGKIDEVRLYNRSLTEAQAIALYNQGR